jgi:hypothetical protein
MRAQVPALQVPGHANFVIIAYQSTYKEENLSRTMLRIFMREPFPLPKG